MPEESSEEAADDVGDWPELLRPSPIARITMGTVLALVLYLALRKLSLGIAMVFQVDPDAWWGTTAGLMALLTTQALAAIFGAVLSSSGRTMAFALGVAVGGGCGVIFVLAALFGDASTGQGILFVQPVVLAIGGGLAGLIGSRIWPPVPEVQLPVPKSKQSEAFQLETQLASKREPRTAWFRVIVGAGIIVAGAAFAEQFRVETQKATGGMLMAQSRWEARFVACQFAALVIMAGGMFAGAATGAGIRHGVYVGLLGAIGVFALAGTYGNLATPGGFVGDELNLGSSDPNSVIALATMVVGVFAGGLIGGWLGGTLFLPLAPRHMRNRLLRLGGD